MVSTIRASCWISRQPRKVVYAPSATTAARLGTVGVARGRGVLALGDPAYGKSLQPLPATRKEAHAVGSKVLLGKDATVEAFRRTLATQSRWRAVHFACHGLFDPKRPMRSALALAPTDTSDGRLTALDLCGLTTTRKSPPPMQKLSKNSKPTIVGSMKSRWRPSA